MLGRSFKALRSQSKEVVKVLTMRVTKQAKHTSFILVLMQMFVLQHFVGKLLYLSGETEVVLYWNFLSEAQLLRTAMSFIMRTAVLLFSLGKYWQWVFLQMNSMGEGNVLLNNQKKNGIYELLKLLRSISICFGLNSSELHFFAVCFRLDLPLRFSDCGSPAWKKCHTAVLQLFQFSYSHNLV